MGKAIILSSAIQPDGRLEKIMEPLVKKYKIPAKSILSLPEDNLEGMYYIHSGRSRHYMMSEEGTEKVLYFLSAGWLFGESLYLMKKPTELYSVADTDLELWKINARSCAELIRTSPLFNQLVTKCLCYKVQYLHQEVKSLCFDRCRDRLIHILIISTDNERLIDSGWYNLKVQYTHYDLAVQIGSVRVTVSKLLKELCEESIIRTVNRRLQVNARFYKQYTGREAV